MLLIRAMLKTDTLRGINDGFSETERPTLAVFSAEELAKDAEERVAQRDDERWLALAEEGIFDLERAPKLVSHRAEVRWTACDAVAVKVRSRGGRALAIVADVSDASAAIDAVKRADAELGGLDLVVANAGLGTTGHASHAKWEEVARLLDVNVRGAMATLTAAI